MARVAPIAEALQAPIQNAVADVLAAQGGGIVNGYVLVVDFLDADGEPSWAFVCPDGQRIMHTIGIARSAWTMADEQLREAINTEPDGN